MRVIASEISKAGDNMEYVNHPDINDALKRFFENPENHAKLIDEENPIEKPRKKRARKPRPEPTIHEMCKAQADYNVLLPEVRKHFGLSNDSGKPSRKKSQPRPQGCVRILSEHKRNPEETFSFNNKI